ncbi:hypothetical protein [Aeromonas veronii]|uniref:hypothetical protein n=1 Tax=Aeromonas veronii TaxID=654 RepID=UPI0039F719F0
MNARDRKAVARLIEKLTELRSQCEVIAEELTELADMEQEKYDNMSEGLQASERGQAIMEAAENLSNAAGYCEEGNIGECVSLLEEI